MKKIKLKRILASILSLVLLIMSIVSNHVSFNSYANEVRFSNLGNVWKGSAINILGHRRNYLFKWKSPDGKYTFCIEEGKHMGRDVRAIAGTYKITDTNVPYISDKEMFTNLALISNWVNIEKKNNLSNADYAAAQMAVWAVMRSDLDMASSLASQIETHVSGSVVASMNALLAYMNEEKSSLSFGNGIYTNESEALANPINMENINGTYEARIDLSSYPELKTVFWRNTENIITSISGNELVLRYTGSGEPKALLRGQAPEKFKKLIPDTETLTIYTPVNKNRDQAMISASLEKETDLYINVGGTTLPVTEAGELEIEVYKHSERFESDYHVELQKFDFETGKTLEGASFEVLESFDDTQLGSGENGTVSSESMSPSPVSWQGFRVMGEITTDTEGKASYSDKRYYDYEKIYVGHPEPEYLEIPEAGTGEDGKDNSEEIEAKTKENERLRQQYEAIVELCEEMGYFHNNDIEVARQQMIDDRDATYETFINLRYKYTFREIKAREGYILHGKHNDDEMIEVIETNSSQAGAVANIEHININDLNINSANLRNNLLVRNVLSNEGRRLVLPTFRSAGFSLFSENLEKIKSSDLVATKSELRLNSKQKEGISGRINLVEDKLLASPSESLENNLSINISTDKKIDKELAIDNNEMEASIYTYAIAEKENVVSPRTSFFRASEDDDIEYTSSIEIDFTLPEAIEDDVEEVSSGDTSRISHKFEVFNNRTEGEIHINKRDLELYKKDKDNSYAKTQGDATLLGAVYGLYASNDIIHPDGKTGAIYKAGDLVSIATTDENGDASFLVFTEESETSLSKENKYNSWIGRPLILGSYYIKELSRSEGYELSVSGKSKKETNKNETSNDILAFVSAGNVSASSLSHSIDEHDGSTNDTVIKYYKTDNGFKVFVSGYPEGTKFYKVNQKEEEKVEKVVKETYLATKTDALGNVVYKKASGGELKLDANGNPKEVAKSANTNPESEILYTFYRLNLYPNGNATPADNKKWEGGVDLNYLIPELSEMFKSLGYKEIKDTELTNAVVLEINANTNKELGEAILNYLAKNSFYDSVSLIGIEENSGNYKVKLVLDYKGQKGISIYEPRTKKLYVRKNYELSSGKNAHVWLEFNENEYKLNLFSATITPKKIVKSPVSSNFDVEKNIEIVYRPEYERYAKGEYLLDLAGEKIPELELKYIYENVKQSSKKESVEEIRNFTYDESIGIYTLSFDNEINWENETEAHELILRLQTKEKSIEVDGKTIDYSDYLTQVKGAGVSAITNLGDKNLDDSYIEFVNLLYSGQMQVYSDANTRNEAKTVLQRVIKQAVKVTKSVSKTSYNENNTYKIHKDPFTVLFGGFNKEGKEFVKGFNFRIYLVSDLEKENLLSLDEKGDYNYKKLFADESKKDVLSSLAIKWDKEANNLDNDLSTLTASLGTGKEAYYATSIALPYGKYVIEEVVPTYLVNKHYEIDEPKEIEIPFVPSIDEDGNIYDDIASSKYIYWDSYTPEELVEKFGIRFNEEVHEISAHSHDGDFKVYKYGLKKDLYNTPYENKIVGARYKYGESENAGNLTSVYYDREYDLNGNVIDYGSTKENVATMIGKSVAVNGKYAKALVPYSVLEPRYGKEINDAGDIGNRDTGLDKEGKFNFIAFAKEHFENTFYSSKLRIEKLDFETGENIIHEGALFKIYAAKRDVVASGLASVSGTGNVAFETVDISGTRKELEARGDVDNIIWDSANNTYKGSITRPIYDENEQIFLKDDLGNEVGIFKAYSTETEVLKEDGTVTKEKLGYIETFNPLGAGTYVLVEVKAPAGYMKSKPIAFEVYKDEITYYADGEANTREKATRYQYVKPLTSTDKTKYVDVAKVVVKDKPSTLRIHKVEDGDSIVGDKNATDSVINVNDKGDLLTYIVKGRKEYLQARGDVENIRFDKKEKLYFGEVRKTFDKWSEDIVEIDEATALATSNMKPLYKVDTGNYSGYAIKFLEYVSGATMTLFEGLELTKLGSGYKGVEVIKENGKIKKIVANHLVTGIHTELSKVGKDKKVPNLPIYDSKEFDNEAVELFFYDLASTKTITNEAGESFALDDRGNKISYIDLNSGLAYTKDDYGKIIAYISENGTKKIAKEIEVHNDNNIYINKESVKDENGLVKYYTSGNLTYRDLVWDSTNSYKEIKRLAFGAYILEETKVPYEKGYIKAMDRGFILRESSEKQDLFYDNEFTKLNIAKIDITTKAEIKDATMSLYRANKVLDNSPRGYHLEKGDLYTEWISGYEYDDRGNIKLKNGKYVPTTKPHFIDHIPVGYYILEERIVPYKDGYVKSESIEIEVKETGNVQTSYMEDDYTALEIKKYDTKTGKVLSTNKSAGLALYKVNLDENNKPILKTIKDDYGKDIQVPTYDKENLIVKWNTADGMDVKATARLVTDEYEDTYTKYEYEKIKIKGQTNAYYYITENGTTRFNYLPVGYYALVEEDTPIGYASAKDMLIHIEDIGSKKKIHKYEMPDVPINVDFYKESLNKEGNKKIIKGAKLAIYKLNEADKKQGSAVYSFITGTDGRFSKKEEIEGKILDGYKVGDLKPHLIEYMPVGKYVLVEEETPFGFVKSEDVVFEVKDTSIRQNFYMYDEIPKGSLELIKLDSESKKPLKDAKFEYRNKTLNTLLETLVTNEGGKASASDEVYIGYVNEDGVFKAFTYEIKEVDAPIDYMLNPLAHEFEYSYENDTKLKYTYKYDALNDINQVKISKKELISKEELEGAKLKVYERDSKKIVDEWISTKQVHYIKGLKEGKYILEETITPDGNYAKASDIEFEITKNMTKIPYVEMFDDHSKIEIKKTMGNSEILLAGAKLSLKNEKGKVLYEWLSTDKPYHINGLSAGTYIISEIEAPKGYEKASDMRIEVKDTLEKQEFIFRNYPISTGGNGGEVPKRYISFKKTDDKGNLLAGAEFTFYKSDGSILTKATSNEKGIIRIEKPANGTYTFKETNVLKGFYKNDKVYTLVVNDNDVKAEFNLINIPIKEIEIVKKDLDTGKALAGAVFNVSTPSKNKFSVTSDKNGKVRFIANELGIYELVEIKAPKGYKLSKAKYLVAVNEDGSITGDTVIYNSNKKVGRILLSYKDNLYGVPLTADSNNLLIYLIMFILSILALGFSLFRAKKLRNVLSVIALIICIFTFFSSFSSKEVYANINENIQTIDAKDIERISDIEIESIDISLDKKIEPSIEVLDEKKIKVKKPIVSEFDIEKELIYKDKTYVLNENTKNIFPKENEAKTLRKDIVFSNVEDSSKIPEVLSIPVRIKDDNAIRTNDLSFVLKETSTFNEHWSDDFKVNMTFVDYDADEFVFFGKTIAKENVLEELRKYDKQILDSLGLNGDFYKISSLTWQGDEFTQNGVVYRNVLVSGSKLKIDIRASYEATYESIINVEFEGIYKLKLKGVDEKFVIEKNNETDIFVKLNKFIKNPMLIFLLILLLFLIIIIYVISKMKPLV